jgi:glyoxylase-like metal-dependent hydrolase (beta-lactamase superfamily II)
MTDTSVTPARLYAGLEAGERPFLLDVRNRDEFARWRIEGPLPLELLNVPYFEFIEREKEAVARVRTGLAGRTEPVVAVCAKGDSSAFVVESLREHGIAATNLAGGMAAWGLGTVVRPLPASAGVRAWQVHRFGRGCLSYVVGGRGDAVVVDPHRAVDEYRTLLDTAKLTLRAVLDTHLHADHVSGARTLATVAGVPYLASARDFSEAAFGVEAVNDRERLLIGGVEVVPVVPLHTPGHTPGSTSFLVNDALLLTGDTVFVDGVGRPDLGGQTAEWARELYHTLRERLAVLGPDLTVLPAHASGPHEQRPDGTVAGRLGSALATSEALQVEEATFVRRAEAHAGGAPTAYATIRAINLGRATAGEDELVELELGKNECALARH